MRSFALLSLLAACVPAPSVDGDYPPTAAAGTSIAAACEVSGLALSWSLAAQEGVDHYELALSVDGQELERFTLAADGDGTSSVGAATAEACVPCTAMLIGVDASGVGSTLLALEVSADRDGDGFVCGPDCDDGDAAVNPSGAEVCDGLDNDCSGLADDVADAPLADLQDGVCAGTRQVCDGAGGWVEPNYALLADYEAVEASCDGLDNDCSGQADDLAKAPPAELQDGVCAGQTKVCDGQGGWIEPDYTAIADYEAVEVSCDGLDNDCSGQADDLDGAPLADNQDGVCAGAAKVCDGQGGWTEPDYANLADYEAVEGACDGLDNDCDGTADNFARVPPADLQDGVCVGSVKVCNGSGWEEPDYTAIAEYSEFELCDGLDNNCDGGIDDPEDAPLADKQGGVCEGQRKVCDGNGGWAEPDYTAIEGYELSEQTCDGLDNDCDQTVDDVPWDAGGLAAKQLGVCEGAVLECFGGEWVEPDYTWYWGYEEEEVSCDGLDNDCDGTVDNAPNPPVADKTLGVCAGSVKVCAGDLGWQEPNYTAIAEYEVLEEACDGLDNDCDGRTDVTVALDTSDAAMECWGTFPAVVPTFQDTPDPTLVTVSVGVSSACGLDATGTAWCWGINGFGEVGDGSLRRRNVPTAVTGGLSFETLEVSRYTVCSLDAAGATYCWGREPGGSTKLRQPTLFPGPAFTSLSVSDSAICGLDTDGALWCDGKSSDGQFQYEDTALSDGFVLVDAGPWTGVDIGDGHVCAREAGGTIECWGRNSSYQAGGSTLGTVGPTVVAHPNGRAWTDDIQLGGTLSCAVDEDGATWCWGNAWGSSATPYVPVEVPGGPYGLVTVQQDGCGLRGDGLFCWGDSVYGVTNGAVRADAPIQLADHTDVVGLDVYDTTGCYLRGDGSLYCWGNVATLLTGVIQEFASPVGTVASSDEGPCYLALDGSLWCQGTNFTGTAGVGSTDPVVAPVRVAAGPFQDLVAGSQTLCAIDLDGNRWCWGRYSAMGSESGDDKLVPWQDPSRAWRAVDMADLYGAGIADDQTLYTWQLWDPHVQVSATDTYQDVARGTTFTCAIDTSGELSCWGGSGRGVLGSDTTLDYANRRVIGTGPWKDVDARYAHVCALHSDNTLWCWGLGDSGQIGSGGSSRSNPDPRQLPGSWQTVSAGTVHTCGIQLDGSLWCWGSDAGGQIANLGNAYEPELIDGGPFVSLDASAGNTCAVRASYVESTCE
ncbi:MAG: hypothetical protein EP330_28855 [Deltaproteobacteria bacterium]|nr:MAG: hypothetical protein EP330_28855 [Deltaproteobacteria bacterium]